MSKGPEALITEKLLKNLRRIPKSFWWKQHQSGYGQAGIPDILGTICGRFFAIEVKCPGKEPTPNQHRIMEAMRAAGAQVFCIHSLEELNVEFQKLGIFGSAWAKGSGEEPELAVPPLDWTKP